MMKRLAAILSFLFLCSPSMVLSDELMERKLGKSSKSSKSSASKDALNPTTAQPHVMVFSQTLPPTASYVNTPPPLDMFVRTTVRPTAAPATATVPPSPPPTTHPANPPTDMPTTARVATDRPTSIRIDTSDPTTAMTTNRPTTVSTLEPVATENPTTAAMTNVPTTELTSTHYSSADPTVKSSETDEDYYNPDDYYDDEWLDYLDSITESPTGNDEDDYYDPEEYYDEEWLNYLDSQTPNPAQIIGDGAANEGGGVRPLDARDQNGSVPTSHNSKAEWLFPLVFLIVVALVCGLVLLDKHLRAMH